MKLPFRTKKRETYRWSALAMYNAEVGRGIVHTKDWDAIMAQHQKEFEDGARQHAEAQGYTVLDGR